MSETAERFRRVANDFTTVVDAVSDEAWVNPSPCEGWTARDVVAHLVEWIPGPGFLLGAFGIETGPIPSVDDDPGAAWALVRDTIQAALDSSATAAHTADCGPLGALAFDTAVEMTVVSDVFVHTWDLAQAAGLDAPLDSVELTRQHDALMSIPPEVDAAMRTSGHYGPRAPTTDNADALTVVLAFYGRRPTARPNPTPTATRTA